MDGLQHVDDSATGVLEALVRGLSRKGQTQFFKRVGGERVLKVELTDHCTFALDDVTSANRWMVFAITVKQGKRRFCPVFCSSGFHPAYCGISVPGAGADWDVERGRFVLRKVFDERQLAHADVAERWLRDVGHGLMLDVPERTRAKGGAAIRNQKSPRTARPQ